MIGLLHGYLLEGSGSNLWTRSIIQALCKQGKTVHLFCQENHPEIYDFISEAFLYKLDGTVRNLLTRDTAYPGKCILHKPKLGDLLPVFVWDHYEEFERVVPMVELPDPEIEHYLNRYTEVVGQVVGNHRLQVLHANHAVLMSVVAQRVSGEYGIPYAIMPHGSAIEYAVKKDERFFEFAREAFDQARKLFTIGPEIHQRVWKLFPSIPGIQEKMTELNLGADTSLFTPIGRGGRRQNIDLLCERLVKAEKGKTPELTTGLTESLGQNIDLDELLGRIEESAHYTAKLPDADAAEKLGSIDWEHERIILFVGRMIASKGLQSIVAALPDIMEEAPNTRLVVVGHGPQREVLEVLIQALKDGNPSLFRDLIEWGSALEGSAQKPYGTVKRFLEMGDGDTFVQRAQRALVNDPITFTGYLTHQELRYLFPCCDVAVFPSVVAEAGPLVFLEALASGCFPLGTYFAGMGASIDSVAHVLDAQDVEVMRLSHDEETTVRDIAMNVPKALRICEKYKPLLREVAVEKYDWRNVARKFSDELAELTRNLNNQ